MAPWSDREECNRDHSFCTQLADIQADLTEARAECERLRMAMIRLRAEMLAEGAKGWPNQIAYALAQYEALTP